MFLGIRTKYWYYLSVASLLVGMMLFAHFSPVFALRRIEVTGPLSEGRDLSSVVSLDSPSNIFSRDKVELARIILTDKKVGNVSVGISLPDGIVAEVNKYAPLALVLDKKLYGMDRQGRIVPYDYQWDDIDLPVITGLKVKKLFDIPRDNRVWAIISGLQYAKENRADLLSEIAELDLSRPGQIVIFCQHDACRFVASAGHFNSQLDHMWAILNLENRPSGGSYDLQYDGMIIRRDQ